MKKIILGIMAILVVVMLVAVAIVVIAGDGIWSSPWEDDDDDDVPDPGSIGGEWGQEIIIGYVDGTSESLKSVVDNPLRALSVNVDGQEVEYFKYLLSAKASGQGYSVVNVDFSDYIIKWELKSGEQVLNIKLSDFTAYPVIPIYVDSEWHFLVSLTYAPIALVPDGTPSGSYTLVLTPSGTLSYEKDGTWIDADLPDIISFEVEVVSDGWLEVSFSSGYSVS